ncbi:MAG: site-specific integrase [Candidatus Parvarchaeum sp.]
MKLGFESRPEHLQNASTNAGSNREESAKLPSFKQAKKGFDFSSFLNLVEVQSRSLNFHELKALKSAVNAVFVKKYRGSGAPKYGSINKGFTELELQRFLRSVKNEKFGLLFKYQAYLGLRIGEVCKLHLSNIDFDKRELTIESEKSKKMDSLRIPLDLFKETIEYITKNADAIKSANGYVFFKENDNNHNKVMHIDQNYARKVFRETIQRCGLDTTYGSSDESLYHRRERTLHRLTTHSLRHYAITHFAKSTNGNVVLTSRFARHSNPMVTMRYISRDNEQLFSEIDNTFSNNRIEEIKVLSAKFKKA